MNTTNIHYTVQIFDLKLNTAQSLNRNDYIVVVITPVSVFTLFNFAQTYNICRGVSLILFAETHMQL